jgi:hypothetical protein
VALAEEVKVVAVVESVWYTVTVFELGVKF